MCRMGYRPGAADPPFIGSSCRRCCHATVAPTDEESDRTGRANVLECKGHVGIHLSRQTRCHALIARSAPRLFGLPSHVGALESSTTCHPENHVTTKGCTFPRKKRGKRTRRNRKALHCQMPWLHWRAEAAEKLAPWNALKSRMLWLGWRVKLLTNLASFCGFGES